MPTPPGKRHAVHALTEAATRVLGPSARVGRLQRLGEGLSRRAWRALVRAADGTEHDWVALVPRYGDAEYFAAERALLAALAARSLPFHTPRPIAAIPVDDVTITILTTARGAPVSTWHALRPEEQAQIIANVAAAIHAISPEGLPFPDTQHPTCHENAVESIATIEAIDARFIDDVMDWCFANLPDPVRPAVVVHGDLLGQNVLWTPDGPTTVIDWEYAGTGDPAWDLAIVTRGQRRVVGDRNGRRLLLDAYNAQAARAVTPAELRLYELALVAGEVTAFLEDYPHAREDQLGRLRNVFRRPLEA